MATRGRVGEVSSVVIKALWLFVCFMLFLYLVVSVVHTRAAVERLLTVLVASGCLVALGAIMQRRSGFNPFDHLHFALPGFDFNPEAVGEGSNLQRGGT